MRGPPWRPGAPVLGFSLGNKPEGRRAVNRHGGRKNAGRSKPRGRDSTDLESRDRTGVQSAS